MVNPSPGIKQGLNNHSVTSTRSTVILQTYWHFHVHEEDDEQQQPLVLTVLHFTEILLVFFRMKRSVTSLWGVYYTSSEVRSLQCMFRVISSSSKGWYALILLSHYSYTQSPPQLQHEHASSTLTKSHVLCYQPSLYWSPSASLSSLHL
jgi:hypothetical protein